jgi:hypothetical protein
MPPNKRFGRPKLRKNLGNTGLETGDDFSRADKLLILKRTGFTGCRKTQLYRLQKNSTWSHVLCQGTSKAAVENK